MEESGTLGLAVDKGRGASYCRQGLKVVDNWAIVGKVRGKSINESIRVTQDIMHFRPVLL